MARARSPFLKCHAHTALVSYEWHHIDPLGMGGADVRENMTPICCNTHSDTHYLMNRMLGGKSTDLREYGPTVRELASLGYAAVTKRWDAYAARLTQQAQQ